MDLIEPKGGKGVRLRTHRAGRIAPLVAVGILPAGLCALLLLGGCDARSTARVAFEEEVVPVLEQRCASTLCHGVAPDAESRGEVVDWARFHFRVDAGGLPADLDQLYTVTKRYINTAEDPAFSSLLRKPLGTRLGGLPHYGGTNLTGPDDQAYQVLWRWISLEAGGGEAPLPLDELERQFAEKVQPVLVDGTCMTAACHGPAAGAIPYTLDTGYDGAFPTASTRHNYLESLRQLSLDGDPLQSRLIRKSRSLAEGGIAHKGTNFDFYAGEPGDGVRAIVDWACAERLARTGRPCAETAEPPVRGFVFIQGPLEPHHPFTLDVFSPGRDLYLATVRDHTLEPITIENLTGSLHQGPVDIRDVAVSPAGDALVFAMRTRRQEGHHLYLLELESRTFRQLTSGNGTMPGGGMATDRDPTFGPDGSIWFVSTREGVLGDSGQRLDADLYSLEIESGAVRRWTFTPHTERKPGFYRVGPHAGEVSVSVLREAVPAQARAHPFRFPPDLSSEYHQHFGITPEERLFFDMREMPDGRYVAMVGDLTGVWRAGQLGMIDRNFGPQLEAESTDAPGLPLYLPPFVTLDPDASSQGVSSGAWRDPAPLPDGRLLAAYAPSSFDLADPDAAPTFRIELLSLEEVLDGSGPRLAERRVLVEVEGVSVFDPEPVYVRAPVRLEAPAQVPAPGATTGLFYHGGLPMIDALLSNLAPAGMKSPREGLRAVRLVEALPVRPSERVPVPAAETRHGIGGASSTGLTAFAPSRILAEMPLADDGTFQAEVPAGIPFRLQPLDARGMAVGTMHNRWYDLAPGQTIRQGVSTWSGTARYETLCGACHGTADGRQGTPELEPPDALTSASLTLSRFERQDPRRPIAPPVVGKRTRIMLDFVSDVQPILTARCTPCHSSSSPAGGLSLTDASTAWYTDAYESLLEPTPEGGFRYIDARNGRARGSYLIEMLSGLELDAPRALHTPGLQHPAEFGGEPLSDEDLQVLIRWIDLGAGFRSGG